MGGKHQMKHLIPIMVILLIVSTSFVGVSYNIEKSSNSSLDRKILYVGGSGPGNYTSIQDAIDDANNGDTIFVFNGTYFENLNVDKSIRLIGENRDITVIEGGKVDSVVEVIADNVCIEGFTITNGVEDFSEAGINVFSNWTIIRNNILLETQCNGVRLAHSFFALIENNFFKNNIYYHINLRGKSNNNTVKNNILTVSQDWHRMCNGIALSTSSNNLVEKNEIVGMDFGTGIIVYGPSGHNTIRNNLIHNNPCSSESNNIQISSSDYNLIINNKLLNNSGCGIAMFFSEGNEIIENTIGPGQKFGIGLQDCRYNNTIKFNDISFTETGIGLYIYSSKNIVESNNLSNNTYGIFMRGTDLLNYVPNNIIRKNNLIGNDYGVYITVSKVYGPSNDNLIYYNNFINNIQNAYDNCSNMWNKSGFGNYWDDYTGIDTNDDGIGDSSFYDIPDNGNQDMYPLMESFVLTELKINIETGPFKISNDIENIGNRVAFNVKWKMTIEGGIIREDRNKSGAIDFIYKPPHPNPNADIGGKLGLGLGKLTITIKAEADNAQLVTKSIRIYLLLFLIIPI